MDFGEPPPEQNDGPSMHDLVIEDMQARKQFGLDKYGTPLQAFNGRRPIKDLYEELLDATVYARQALEEEEQRSKTISNQLDGVVGTRMAVNGVPEAGPYPATVSEVADEVMTWLTEFEQHAPGIVEAVGNRIGVHVAPIAKRLQERTTVEPVPDPYGEAPSV